MMRRLVGVWLLGLVATAAGAAEPVESTYTRGLASYHAGQFADAIDKFDDVLRADPERVGALYYRGLAKAQMERYGEAIPDLESAGRSQPDLPVAESLGRCYFETGQRAEAKTWLQKAIGQRPPGAAASLLLGIIAYEEGDLPEAERRLAAAEVGAPNLKGSVAYYRGMIAAQQGRREDARARFVVAQSAADPAVARAASGRLQSLGERPAPVAAVPRLGVPGLSASAFAGFEYDSNVVLQDIDVSTGKSDGRFVLGAGGIYQAIRGDQIRWNVGYDIYQSLHFDLSDFNLQGHTLRTDLEFGDSWIVPGIDAQYAFYLIEDRTYFQELLGSPFLLIDEMGIGQVELYYRIRGRDYLSKPFNPARDATNHAIGFRQVFFLGAADQTVDVGYQFDREDPESSRSGREFDYSGNQVDIGVRWPIPGIAGIELRYGFRNEDYTHGNSRAEVEVVQRPGGVVEERRLNRRDDLHWVLVAVTRDLTDRVYARLGYIGQFNDSNIVNVAGDEFFGYDRHIVSATLGVNF